MIIVTGAAGFIGSNLLKGLNQAGYKDLLIVDDFSRPERERNYSNKQFAAMIDRKDLSSWIREHHRQVQISGAHAFE